MKHDCQAVLAEVHALQQQNEVWDPMNLGSNAVAQTIPEANHSQVSSHSFRGGKKQILVAKNIIGVA